MSARAEAGGSTPNDAGERSRTNGGSVLWIMLTVLVFAAALGGGYVVARGRLTSATPATVAPTAIAVIATAVPAQAASAAPATPSVANVAPQPTLSADQAQSSYLWQQSHEQDMCSCNTGAPPSSP